MVPAMTHTYTPIDSPAYRDGLARLCKLEATERPSILDSLADIAPDLAHMVIGFVYGEVYARPQLSLADRQLVTVAALAALGNARPQLQFHIAGALNAGCASGEIVELMLQLAVYAGFPAALNGVFAAQEVFLERGVRPSAAPTPHAEPRDQDRFGVGWRALRQVDGHAGERVIESLANIAPDLGRFVIEFAFGDIYTRPGLPLLQRELVTVAALVAMGTAAPQLAVHVHGLLNVGGTQDQLVEAIIQVAPYAGFPAAINAMRVAQTVSAQRRAGEPARSG